MYKLAGIAIFMPTYRGGWRGKKNVKIHTISSCVRSSAHHRPIHVLESKLAVIHYFNYYLLLCVSPSPIRALLHVIVAGKQEQTKQVRCEEKLESRSGKSK